jgi:hypothetical protein
VDRHGAIGLLGIQQGRPALANGEGLAAVFDRLRAAPNPERSVGFTIAILALAAKTVTKTVNSNQAANMKSSPLTMV